MPLTVETCVAHHPGDRLEQQDRVSLFAHPERAGLMMAVLADGMGGHSGGAMAAEQVIIKARQNFDAFKPGSETAQSLLASIVDEAHQVIRLTRFTTEHDPHSTAVILLLQPGRLDWVHCGDSRFYHFRDGRTLSRSADHSLVGALLRQGEFDQASALNHTRRNVLLSCLGGEAAPGMAFGHLAPLQAGDSFLLCSDGLWAYFADQELAAIVHRAPARAAATRLVTVARERALGEGDNIALALIKLVEAER